MTDRISLRILSVQELLDKYPATIPVFMRYGMACVGCDLSPFESVDEAIAIYHLESTPFFDEIERAAQRTGASSEEP